MSLQFEEKLNASRKINHHEESAKALQEQIEELLRTTRKQLQFEKEKHDLEASMEAKAVNTEAKSICRVCRVNAGQTTYKESFEIENSSIRVGKQQKNAQLKNTTESFVMTTCFTSVNRKMK